MNAQSLNRTEPPHWQRVRDEREQLSKRVNKLESFLKGEASLSIAADHLILLRLQLAIMKLRKQSQAFALTIPDGELFLCEVECA